MNPHKTDPRPHPTHEPHPEPVAVASQHTEALPEGWWQRLKRRPIVPLVLALGAIGGPVFASLLFPEAPMTKQLLGGWVAGFYFALCAIPEQFLEL